MRRTNKYYIYALYFTSGPDGGTSLARYKRKKKQIANKPQSIRSQKFPCNQSSTSPVTMQRASFVVAAEEARRNV